MPSLPALRMLTLPVTMGVAVVLLYVLALYVLVLTRIRRRPKDPSRRQCKIDDCQSERLGLPMVTRGGPAPSLALGPAGWSPGKLNRRGSLRRHLSESAGTLRSQKRLGSPRKRGLRMDADEYRRIAADCISLAKEAKSAEF